MTMPMSVNIIRCFKCSVDILLRPDVEEDLRRTKREFYCMNGHSQAYIKSREQERIEALERDLASATSAKQRAEQQYVALNNKCQIEKNRCKLCNRGFTSPEGLKMHIGRVHKGIKKLPAEAGPSNP